MKKLLFFLLVIVVILAGAISYLYFNLNSLVKKGIEEIGPKITKTSVNVKDVKISLFSGQGALYDFVVGNPKGFSSPYLLRVGEFIIKLEPMTIFKDLIIIDKVYIDSPKIILEYQDKTTNLQAFKNNISPTSKEPQAEGSKSTKKKEKKLLIKELILKKPQVEVTLAKLGLKKKQVIIDEIRLTNLGGKNQSTKDIIEQITKALMDKALPAAMPALEDLKKGIKDIEKKARESFEEMKKGNLKNLQQKAQDLQKGNFNKEEIEKKVQDIKKNFQGFLPKN